MNDQNLLSLLIFCILLIYRSLCVTKTPVYTSWIQCSEFECYDKRNECERIGSDFSSKYCFDLMSPIEDCLKVCIDSSTGNIVVDENCLNQCEPNKITTIIADTFTACRLDSLCHTQLQLDNYLIRGFYNCFKECQQDYQQFTIMPLQDNLYGDYSSCIDNQCEDLRTSCFTYENCINYFDLFYRGVITCSMSNGTYNQYKESWTQKELYIQSRCIQQTYQALYPQNADYVNNFRRAMKLFLCYVDCSLGDASINKLKKYNENMLFLDQCAVITCSPFAMNECPDEQTCWSYGRGVNACIRLQLLYDPGDNLTNFQQLAQNCSFEILQDLIENNETSLDTFVNCLNVNCSSLTKYVTKLILSITNIIILLMFILYQFY